MTTKSTKSKKEPEVSFYTDKKGKKKWRFRHRYYDSLGELVGEYLKNVGRRYNLEKNSTKWYKYKSRY